MLQSTGSQRVRHDLVPEQQHWDKVVNEMNRPTIPALLVPVVQWVERHSRNNHSQHDDGHSRESLQHGVHSVVKAQESVHGEVKECTLLGDAWACSRCSPVLFMGFLWLL